MNWWQVQLATKIAHEMMPEAKIGCMVLNIPIYPLTPHPDDMIEVMERRHMNDFSWMYM